jgi:virginiamycin B lyase
MSVKELAVEARCSKQFAFSKVLIFSLLVSLLVLSSVVVIQFQSSKNGTSGAISRYFSSSSYASTSGDSAIYSPDMIRNFSLPSPNAGPNSIVEGPNGTFWIAEYDVGIPTSGPGKIAEFFSTNETFKEFTMPKNGSVPNSIAIDQFGTVWFSDFGGDAIWSLNGTSGVFTRYAIPTKTAQPLFVLVDQNHDIWFTETTGYKIGELSYPTYSLSEYTIPTSGYEPLEMFLDQSTSTLWITLAKTTSEVQPGLIATFNISTKRFESVYTPNVSLQDPVGIVLDKSGNVWVSEHRGSSVVEFTPSNSTWRKFETSPPSGYYQTTISAVATISIDQNGNLWFIEHFGNKVGRLNPSTGVIDEFDLTGQDDPFSVLNAIDTKGNYWLTNFGQNAVQMIPANASTGIYIRTVPTTSDSIYPQIIAGQSLSVNFAVSNLAPQERTITLNATSSFTASGQTSSQEVSFNVSGDVLHLAANQSALVQAKITPDAALPSGLYSVSIAAMGTSSSSVQVFFLNVTASPFYLFYHLGDYLQEILIIAIVSVGILFLLLRRRSPKPQGKMQNDSGTKNGSQPDHHSRNQLKKEQRLR